MAMLQELADRHVLSAPVLTGKQPTKSGHSGSLKFGEEREVVGFLDIRDILLAFLKHLGGVQSLLQMPLQQRLHHVEASGAAFSRNTVRESVAYGDDGNFLYFGKVRPLWLGTSRRRLHGHKW
jgi:hypothetical protein